LRKIALLVFVLLTLISASCAVGSEKVLEKMDPSLRADYRDGLEDLAREYDERYDRDGMPLQPVVPTTPTTDE